MALIKDGHLVNDPFVFTADDDPALPDGRAVLVTVTRWHADRSKLIFHNGLVGIRLACDQSPDLIADDLKCLAVVTVEFKTFSDGRGFSAARALRERYGYTGEIRATGHTIRDQYLFLHRCGVNAIEVSNPDDLLEWEKAMAEISLFYQTTVDGRMPVMSLRHRSVASAK